MKKHLLSLIIFLTSLTSQAQFTYYKELGLDSTVFAARFDSAVKANPGFSYTTVDSVLLFIKLLSPEDLAKLKDVLTSEFENNDPYKHISTHLEGGWEVAATADNDEYWLIKPLRGDKYWVKKLTKTYKGEYYKSSLTLFKIDCREGMLGIVQHTEYDASGKVANSSDAIEDIIVSMNYATPDTVGEALVESACK